MKSRLINFGIIFLLYGCHEASLVKERPPYQVQKDQIVISKNSPFLKHLEIVKTVATPRHEVTFKSVGQIIALANRSDVFTNATISWVELDSRLTRSAGLSLPSLNDVSIGTAFGITLLPTEYLKELHLGQTVEIARYGLKKSEIEGQIIKIETDKPDDQNQNSKLITFKITKGQEWYPGTNCEVHFPLSKLKVIEVPTTAVLHEGLHEFVLREISLGNYEMVQVFIVDETPMVARVLGINASESIIASGAILLKPELHQFIQGKGIRNVLR